jgi:hypothetical protein
MTSDHPFNDLLPILTALKRMGGFPFYIEGKFYFKIIGCKTLEFQQLLYGSVRICTHLYAPVRIYMDLYAFLCNL